MSGSEAVDEDLGLAISVSISSVRLFGVLNSVIVIILKFYDGSAITAAHTHMGIYPRR